MIRFNPSPRILEEFALRWLGCPPRYGEAKIAVNYGSDALQPKGCQKTPGNGLRLMCSQFKPISATLDACWSQSGIVPARRGNRL